MVRITSSEGRLASESTEFKMVAGRVMVITSLDRLPSKESLVIFFLRATNPHTMMKKSMAIWVNVCWKTSIAERTSSLVYQAKPREELAGATGAFRLECSEPPRGRR